MDRWMCVVLVAAALFLREGDTRGHGVRSYRVDVRMPGVSPKVPEKYLCTSQRLSSRKAFITHFEALATMKTAHHILLYGCKSPGEYKDSWDCNMGRTCGKGESQILYAWARDAPPLALPIDVGFQVGNDAGINYLVVQVHYARMLADNESDHSGLRVHLTTARQPFSAGIFLFSTDCLIPAHAVGKHCDMTCRYSSNIEMVPFAYRTHTHHLGRSVSAYRIRNGKWSLIGIGSPQAPQAFYPIRESKREMVKSGDQLAGRCTYDALNNTHSTHMGSTSSDEMCNFYMMYYTSTPEHRNSHPLNGQRFCWRRPSQPLSYPAGSDKLLSGWKGHGLRHRGHPANLISPSEPTQLSSNESLRVEQHPPVGHFTVDSNWVDTVDKLQLGQVSGVAIDISGNVLVFHRGPRIWDASTFDDNNQLSNGFKIGPIGVPTVVRIDVNSGEVLEKWGQNMFYIPHGITVDSANNIWMTDVGAHQVLKFKANDLSRPDLILGKILVPGSDNEHFCKPTDVAVESTGTFYVADGYCNSRIMKFSSDGVLLLQWGRPTVDKKTHIAPSYFNVPHSLALDEEHHTIFVADRENGRIQCFKTDGTFHSQVRQEVFLSTLFAVSFNGANGGTLYAINGPSEPPIQNPHGFTLNPSTGAVNDVWSPAQKGFSQPHDVACSDDNSHVFVAEIKPNRVWKFSSGSTSQSGAGPLLTTTNEVVDDGIAVGLLYPDGDASIIPAIIVVIVLATPILLICVAAVIQNVRLRQARRHVMRSLDETSGPRSRCCGGIFATSKYYYDSRKGFDKLIGDDADSDSDEDVFIRKGAI